MCKLNVPIGRAVTGRATAFRNKVRNTRYTHSAWSSRTFFPQARRVGIRPSNRVNDLREAR